MTVRPQAPGRAPRAAPDPLSVPPPETCGTRGDTEGAWREYREGVNRRLQVEAAASLHGSSTSRSVVRSAMSGIEGDTFVDALSIAPHSSRRADRDLTKCYDFSRRAEEAWRLPIAACREEILHQVAEHQVVVLSGHTGCGKSTQVPQYILDQHVKEKREVNIVVTQPRKIAASSVARRVCQERGWALGKLVGYQVGLDKANKSVDTRLLYVTTGILLKMLIAKKHMNDFTHVILDEVHEREEDMDLLMLIAKKLLLTNSRGTKLILMSATMQEQRFQTYFSAAVPVTMEEVVLVGGDGDGGIHGADIDGDDGDLYGTGGGAPGVGGAEECGDQAGVLLGAATLDAPQEVPRHPRLLQGLRPRHPQPLREVGYGLIASTR